jgi:hypothetical protein
VCILGFAIDLYKLHISEEKHMQLMTSELLNLCHFTHLVTKNIQLQNLVVLMTMILKFSYINEISCHH